MREPIQLSIQSPCHEDWGKMTPADKGRFCASCQKKVHDFTKSSDREIASAFGKDAGLCGRFLPSQLERELYVPKEKNKYWMVASFAVMNIINLFTHHANAQELKQRQNIYVGAPIPNRPGHGVEIIGRRKVSGAIGDKADSLSLSGVTIINKNTLAVAKTDDNGKFSIVVGIGDPIEIHTPGYRSKELVFNDKNFTIILLEKEPPISYILGGAGMEAVEIRDKNTVDGPRLSFWDFFR